VTRCFLALRFRPPFVPSNRPTELFRSVYTNDRAAQHTALDWPSSDIVAIPRTSKEMNKETQKDGDEKTFKKGNDIDNSKIGNELNPTSHLHPSFSNTNKAKIAYQKVNKI
jgi:hypothetical protein